MALSQLFHAEFSHHRTKKDLSSKAGISNL